VEQPPHVLAIVRSGAGSVVSVPAGIDCGATCSFLFAKGVAISLTAAPSSGWKFAGWAGACGGVSGCMVILTGDTTVWATFEPAAPAPGHHFLSVARAGKGTGRVTSSPAGIDCGTSCGALFDEGAIVSLSAIPDSGSKFSSWSGACTGVGGCSVSMAADRSISATFDLPPPPDDCSELRPPDPGPAPRSSLQLLSKSTGAESCRSGFVAGSGTLALPTEDSDPGSGTTLHFVRSTGETLGTASGGRIDLTEQLDGFVAQYFAGGGQYWLSAFDSSGRPFATTPPPNTSGMLEDPAGGVVAVQSGWPFMFLRAYDAQLHLRWSLPLPTSAWPLRVDRAGNTLVLRDGTTPYGSGSVAAFWVDHDGRQGPVFQLIGPGPVPAARPTATVRVESGLFLATGSIWTMQLDSLSTTPAPAPAWLAARPVREMHMVHGGRGYAVLPPNPGDEGPCAQAIEVIAPSGRSCGTSLFRATEGGACKPLGIRVGYDGTVVQQLPSGEERRCPGDSPTQCSCSWHWWPGFFH
jgi:hypothetical protein